MNVGSYLRTTMLDVAYRFSEGLKLRRTSNVESRRSPFLITITVHKSRVSVKRVNSSSLDDEYIKDEYLLTKGIMLGMLFISFSKSENLSSSTKRI